MNVDEKEFRPLSELCWEDRARLVFIFPSAKEHIRGNLQIQIRENTLFRRFVPSDSSSDRHIPVENVEWNKIKTNLWNKGSYLV